MAAALSTAAGFSHHAWLISSPHSSSVGRRVLVAGAYPRSVASSSASGSVSRELRPERCMVRDNNINDVKLRNLQLIGNNTIEDSIALASSNNVNVFSLRPINRIGGRRFSLSTADTMQSSPSNIDLARTAVAITAAALLSVLLVDDITLRFETVQEWRYAWPLIGALYVASGLWSLFPVSDKADSNKEQGILDVLGKATREVSSFVPLASTPVVGVLATLAGVGVLAGGFIDAFFPVWYTSPDLLGTRAGIEADSAAILLILTVGEVSGNLSHYCLDNNGGNVGGRKEHGSMQAGGSNEIISLKAFRFPSWALVVVLCTQLWEIASSTFYSWGELLGVVS